MHWIALRPQLEAAPPMPADPQEGRLQAALDAPLLDPLSALGWWALQYTPRVAQVQESVVFEVSASERLWGGVKPMLHHIYESKKPVSLVKYARGATSLVAIARLQDAALARTLPDDLPLASLAAALPHLATLERIGCTRWGQLRALPRGGVSRRFGAPLLDALDRAYGLKLEVYPWLELPEVFEATLELLAQVETAPALLFGAGRLLRQLQVWLRLRHRGVLALALGWTLDARRNTATHGELVLRTAEPTGDVTHLQRLLGEHLAHVTLPAPVLYLHLRTLQTQPLGGQSASLLPDEQKKGDSLVQLLERLSARLGAQQVLQCQLQADHRPECMQRWQPAENATQLVADYADKAVTRDLGGRALCFVSPGLRPPPLTCAERSAAQTPGGQKDDEKLREQAGAALYPTWLLEVPLKLALHRGQPLYQGPLTLLAGPQRLEVAWWEGRGCALRDYFVARSEQAGLLWVYRERLAGQGGAESSNSAVAHWYLHGLFA